MSCSCSVEKKPDAKLEKGTRGVRAIALMSVLAEWYAAVMVGLLQEEPEPIEWKGIDCRLEKKGRSNCEHMQALLTTLLQRHSERQENQRDAGVPGFFKCQTAFMGVWTVFHVTKSSVVSGILTCMAHGHVVAALEEMKDVRGICFENCGTEFRVARCTRQGGVEGAGWPNVVLCNGDDEYRFSSMIWADNSWVFIDARRKADVDGE